MSETKTVTVLDRLERLEAAATKGPWLADTTLEICPAVHLDDVTGTALLPAGDMDFYPDRRREAQETNVAVAAESRNALPDLLRLAREVAHIVEEFYPGYCWCSSTRSGKCEWCKVRAALKPLLAEVPR